jgi:phosphoribosylformylglycinamidine cyclo-ligase
LLAPTRIYVKPILTLLAQTEIKGMAHITGGGLSENTHRMFGSGLAARIDSTRWPRPAIFDWLQRTGNVTNAEMHRVFNCGIGLVLVVDRDAAQATIDGLATSGEAAYVIGTVEQRKSGSPGTVVI